MLNVLSLLLFLGGVFRWVRGDNGTGVLLMGFGFAFAMMA